MTVAERDELLDAVEHVERELEAEESPGGTVGPHRDVLLTRLADLVARAVRVWVLAAPVRK
jgi:hypothetical protein